MVSLMKRNLIFELHGGSDMLQNKKKKTSRIGYFKRRVETPTAVTARCFSLDVVIGFAQECSCFTMVAPKEVMSQE
jgi:hypothetical protein